MTFFKVCTLILCYFVTRAAFSATCENYQGLNHVEKVCWNESVKGWVSASCTSKECDAVKFFSTPTSYKRKPTSVGGKNPDAVACHDLKYPVVVLKDAKMNEQSFCVFPDKSVVSTDAIGRFVK